MPHHNDNLVFYCNKKIVGIYNERKISLIKFEEEETEVLFVLESNEFYNFICFNPISNHLALSSME